MKLLVRCHGPHGTPSMFWPAISEPAVVVPGAGALLVVLGAGVGALLGALAGSWML